MNRILRRLNHPLLELLLVTLLLSPAFVIFWPSTSADAAIYFTFIKNFFDQPFTYQPHTVSFGATSPLQVILQAPLYPLLAERWWLFGKILNNSFVILGLVILNRAISGTYTSLVLLAWLTLLSPIIFITAAQGYETPLAFLAICALYFCLKHRHYRLILLMTGILYLIRPEFLLIGIALNLYLWPRWQHTPANYRWLLLAMLPVVLYHSYMLYHTGQLMPSSVYVRATSSLSWLERLHLSRQSFGPGNALIYLLGLLGLATLLGRKKYADLPDIMLLLAPLLLLHLLFPPGEHTVRYLSPLTSLLSVVVVGVVRPYFRLALLPLLCLASLSLYSSSGAAPQMTVDTPLDTILLKPLAQQINTFATAEDKILLEEIQAQYYLTPFCYSLSGVVGNQLWPVFTGQETIEHFIQRNNIRYIVISDAVATSPLPARTFLLALHHFDQTNPIGSRLELNEVQLEKKLANLSGDNTWKSVYQVLK